VKIFGEESEIRDTMREKKREEGKRRERASERENVYVRVCV
jgi:hypothetical protein